MLSIQNVTFKYTKSVIKIYCKPSKPNKNPLPYLII